MCKKYFFIVKERNRGTGLLYFGARYLDPEIGRWLSLDRFMDKYPSCSPYNYVLNNPICFTDITGDTVDVDPQLLEPVVYTEGEKKGQTKSLAYMTPAEKQRHFFQQWWSENQEMVNELFGIGGKYETTNISFKLATKPKTFSEKVKSFFAPSILREPQFGQTTWGRQNLSEAEFYNGSSAIKPTFGIQELSINVYFNPKVSRDTGSTPGHEWLHVRIIFDRVKKGEVVPSGATQHDIINQVMVPDIK